MKKPVQLGRLFCLWRGRLTGGRMASMPQVCPLTPLNVATKTATLGYTACFGVRPCGSSYPFATVSIRRPARWRFQSQPSTAPHSSLAMCQIRRCSSARCWARVMDVFPLNRSFGFIFHPPSPHPHHPLHPAATTTAPGCVSPVFPPPAPPGQGAVRGR
jgi:hypothetical protein